MELLFFSILVLLFILISISLNIYYKHKFKPIVGGAKLPPGKMGWPIIGETLEYFRIGRRGVPEEFFRDRMNKFSSQVFTTSLFGEPMAVLCGAEGNKLLFTNENKLVNVWFPRSINKLIPKASTMRYLGGSFLKPEALQSYIGIMDVTARRHLETSWDKNKEVMVFPLVKNYTFSLACKLFLGMNDPDQFNNFSHIFRTLFLGLVSIPVDLPGTRFHRAIKASSLIRNVMHEIIKQRKIDLAEKKASPTQDILSHLLTTSDENGVFMNETDIGSRILGLLIGGYDTTTASITSIVKYLAEHPHVYDQVLKEHMKIAELKGSGEMLNWDDIQKMKYSWNVACETMRLTPTTLGSFREAITDFTYAGFLIPKGMKLFWSSYTTHRNPDNFPNPEKFNPSRFEGNGSAPYTYVPFGGGPRMCPGKEYSRLIILVFMHNLVKKYRWEKSIPDEKIIYDPLPTPAKGLPVRLQPHDMH